MKTHIGKEEKPQHDADLNPSRPSNARSPCRFRNDPPAALYSRRPLESIFGCPPPSPLKDVQQAMESKTRGQTQPYLRSAISIFSAHGMQPVHERSHQASLPRRLKTFSEKLSGYSMDDVKVHYNSSKPAELRAHAYAQGTDIHLAPRQEKHLPHETWHVVQQKQQRVRPTTQLEGKMNINDDAQLEREADAMGARALEQETTLDQGRSVALKSAPATPQPVIQGHFFDGKRVYRHNEDEEALEELLGSLLDVYFSPESLEILTSTLARKLLRKENYGNNYYHLHLMEAVEIIKILSNNGARKLVASDEAKILNGLVTKINTRRGERLLEDRLGLRPMTADQANQLSALMDEEQSIEEARKIARAHEYEAKTNRDGVMNNSSLKSYRKRLQKGMDAEKKYISHPLINKHLREGRHLKEYYIEYENLKFLIDRYLEAEHRRTRGRIVYRIAKYNHRQDIPYSADTRNGIKEGDLVTNMGFLSTSRQRRIVLGKQDEVFVPKRSPFSDDSPVSLVRMAIYTTTGVSIGGRYNGTPWAHSADHVSRSNHYETTRTVLEEKSAQYDTVSRRATKGPFGVYETLRTKKQQKRLDYERDKAEYELEAAELEFQKQDYSRRGTRYAPGQAEVLVGHGRCFRVVKIEELPVRFTGEAGDRSYGDFKVVLEEVDDATSFHRPKRDIYTGELIRETTPR